MWNGEKGFDYKIIETIIEEKRGIEEFDQFECTHCDFANKFLGGGVLRNGCV